MRDTKLILVGGTSHVGKSTLGRRLAEETGWSYLSTDQFARHPGRPWKADGHRLPDDVAEHYMSLSIHELVDSLLQHYRNNVWPIIKSIVQSRLNNPFDQCLVLEGSAILPDRTRSAATSRVASIWLTAPHGLILERIKNDSNYESRAISEQRWIDAFVGRTLAFDRYLKASAEVEGVSLLDSTSADAFATIKSLAGSIDPGPSSEADVPSARPDASTC